MTVTTPNILVFDSGLGGLTIAREIHNLLPHARLTYFGDTAYFPYGSKRAHDLIARVKAQIDWLERHIDTDLIVIACNTASTLVLPELRRQTDTPVVGVVPAIKPAAAHSDTGVIGLLATPGTVQRNYTASLIEEHAGHCEVISVGSTNLVVLAEQKLRGHPPRRAALRAILSPFLEHSRHQQLDTMVLACTHFPLLAEELADAYGYPIHWVDSGTAIAARVAYLLENAPPASKHACNQPRARRPTRNQALFSDPPAEMSALGPWLAELHMSADPVARGIGPSPTGN